MDSNLKTAALAFGACLVSALALYFGTGLHPVWWLVWLAPIPVLAVSPRLSLPWAVLIALAAWSFGGLNVWHYGRSLVGLTLAIALLAMVAPALIFALCTVLFRQRLQRRRFWQAVLIVPVVWVVYEYLLASLSPHSTWGNLAYTQMDFLPIVQIASITGIWGISFCVMFFVSATAAVLSDPSSLRFPLIAAGFLALVLGFGAWRLHHLSSAPEIKVGLVATDVPAHLIPKREAALPVFEMYAAEIQKLASQGAQVVIIPEKSAVVGGPSLAALDRILINAAVRSHVFVLAGVLRIPESYNESRLYSPDGRVAATYDKHHLVPQFEADETPGTRRTTINQPSGKWGLTICKDMDFPKLSRQYGRDGVGLLLVPAWDFIADDWLHDRMAILRGVESGFSMARSAKQGILSVSDSRGRVLAEHQSSASPFSTLVATLPVFHQATIYTQLGDWFAWLNLALFAALLSIFR